MSAKAICNQCAKEEPLRSTPLGVVLMPTEWLVTVREEEGGELTVIDCCTLACAQAFDAVSGRETVIEPTK